MESEASLFSDHPCMNQHKIKMTDWINKNRKNNNKHRQRQSDSQQQTRKKESVNKKTIHIMQTLLYNYEW